jgi:hypothetical protein
VFKNTSGIKVAAVATFDNDGSSELPQLSGVESETSMFEGEFKGKLNEKLVTFHNSSKSGIKIRNARTLYHCSMQTGTRSSVLSTVLNKRVISLYYSSTSQTCHYSSVNEVGNIVLSFKGVGSPNQALLYKARIGLQVDGFDSVTVW